MNRYRPTLVFLALLLAGQLVAQDRWTRLLTWPSVAERPVSEKPGTAANAKSATSERTPAVQAFEGARFDPERDGLPFYNEVLPLDPGVTAVTVNLQDAEYAPLTEAERAAWPAANSVGNEPQVLSRVSLMRKRPYAYISIDPFRRNSATGQVEKLLRFRLELVEIRGGGGGVPKEYPATSKLASGNWFRFTVGRDGVCRITYEFLRDLGVDVNNLSSSSINIYGNHFGQLPYANSVERPTDLLLNAIQVNDGGDGVFGPGDNLIFYVTGPHRWELANGRFSHTKNAYSDSASYFVGIGVDPPKRVTPAQLSQDPPTTTVTTFNDRQFIDRDLVNFLKSGRTWYGETYDLTTTYNYAFDTPNLVSSEEACIVMDVAARTLNSGVVFNSSSFVITSPTGLNGTMSITGVSGSYTGAYARASQSSFCWSASGNAIPLTVTFNKFDPVSSLGWMNWLELNCVRELRFAGDQLGFRHLASVGAGQVAEYRLEQSSAVSRIWEVTDPTDVREVAFATDGARKVFRAAADSLREFIAFRDANYVTPVRVGRVPNQDLHATQLPTDLVIVSPPEYRSALQPLVDRRTNEGLNVHVVSPQQIYNEFSSGSRDATAIKRYMRMLYDRAGADPLLMPRYLLLFGDGSFNNLSWNSTNQNLIPSYQTDNSLDPGRSYTSDDYFGLLDTNESEIPGDLVDIGIGRIPVSSQQMAGEMVAKLLAYDQLQLLSTGSSNCTSSGDGGIADWRAHVLFVSDDQEGDGFEGIIHMDQSDFLARRVETEHPRFNVDKIYMDAYQQVSTPGGERYPQAQTELRDKVQKGCLLVNYVGHGGEVGWAHERLLDNGTILGWTNRERAPLFMTATCEFTRWDDPGRTSAGEYVMLNPSGGGIGLMTTTRLAYSGQNFDLGRDFYDHVFDETDEQGRPQALGDIYRKTKVDMSTAYPTFTNHRSFALIGDPSMRLAMPRLTARITAITDTLGNAVDTLKALATVRISGFVDDGSGQPVSDFNGLVVPTVFDKDQQQSTLANDGGNPFNFRIYKNILYRGKATVTNGQFSFTFVVPKDINYTVGAGRVSCYAESWNTNAVGYTNTPLVGGTATNIVADEIGPRIELFMNDELFVRGGMTNETPLLLGKLFDDNGINTVGSSIGHDLLAVLDENTEQAIVLNDLYEADLDTYKSGSVRYRLSKLAEGTHTLRLKAWDVHNNSNEVSTEFVVASSAELALDHVLNYPNPFTTRTEFFFEHNRPCTTLNVQVQVFTVSGRLVKTLNRQLACEGFRSEPMEWDGRDDFGDKLGRGVYVYRLSVTTPDGENADKFEKLVILR